MALNGKLNTPLLDTLIQLNDLVKSLNGKDFADQITELKQKTADYNVAKSTTEPLILELARVRDASAEAELAAKKAQAALAAERQHQDRQLAKIDQAQRALDTATNAAADKLAVANAELERKTQAVVAREAKANERVKQGDALIAEYQTKLGDLKKITG